MNVLALDIASPEPSVAIAAGAEVIEEKLPADRQASERLLETVERCLARAGLSLRDCERIAVCSGPGSFTGLRVGLATAWGFSRGLGIPVEAVSTLEAMAESARATGVSSVAASLDAGRGEAVIQSFSLEGPRALPLGPARRVPRQEAVPTAVASSGFSVSRALALAVARAPRDVPARAIYSRASAAEEKHGAS